MTLNWKIHYQQTGRAATRLSNDVFIQHPNFHNEEEIFFRIGNQLNILQWVSNHMDHVCIRPFFNDPEFILIENGGLLRSSSSALVLVAIDNASKGVYQRMNLAICHWHLRKRTYCLL